EEGGQGEGGGGGGLGGGGGKGTRPPPVQVGGHHGQWNLERAEVLRHSLGEKFVAQLLSVEQRRAKSLAQHGREAAGARRQHPAEHLTAIVRDRQRVAAHVAA